MKIRKTFYDELEQIMKIYDDGRDFMRKTENLNQWIEGYPSVSLIKDDIDKGNSYVCVIKNEIVGVFTYYFGNEPTYDNINGEWNNDLDYGVIHRMVIANRGKGIANSCIEFCIKDCKYLRIDTHESNMPMRNFLIKNGFNECGIIYLKDGSERVAYDKE